MKEVIRIILTVLIIIIIINAKPLSYISPGIRIGYDNETGVELSFQTSVGFIIEDLGRNMPGFTIGINWNKIKYGFYSDIQVGRFDIVNISNSLEIPLSYGIGIGKMILIYDREIYTDRYKRYNKIKIWGGCFGLMSYEYRFSSKQKNYENMGILGVLPLPLTGNWSL